MISFADSGGGAGPQRVPLADEMRDLFSEDGLLSHSPDFEYRPEQQRMACRVAGALEGGSALVVEAGTGVGKSLAYLAPAARFAAEFERKALLCTHTINLQEQLLHKDIPIIQKLYRADDIRAVLLKGRRNYVCPNRLRRAMEGANDLFTSSEIAELKQIWDWAEETRDGTLSDLPFSPTPKVWAQVCSEPHVCTQRFCAHTGRCFYQEVRKRIADADLVVLNHTLFFTLLSSGEEGAEGREGFIFPNDFAIFDEAHTLENIAARQLGLGISNVGLRMDIQRLYNPRSKKGLFQKLRNGHGVSEAARLLDMVDQFFGDIEFACTFGPYAKEFRVRQTDLVDNTLAESLHTVESIISSESDKTDNESLSLELGDLARKLRAARAGVAEFLDLGQDGHVYWVEKAGHDGGIISLNGAPVNVAELLKDILFAPGRPCVLTSATLGTGDEGLSYFRRRVGGTDAVAEKIGSPFDYRRQMKLYLVRRMPAPNESGFEDALVHWIGHFIQETQGRAFVLFTSYRLLRSVADRMENFFDREGITLLTQGGGMPRHQLIEEFKEDTHSVLFGTDSFWTGVDVPGEALSNVIITRLPFAVPDHPLTAARLEEIEARGGNSFMEYSVPEAILKLRQGIGRLIRSGRDKGIAVILDNRVLTKQYGRAFLAALPECPREVVG